MHSPKEIRPLLEIGLQLIFKCFNLHSVNFDSIYDIPLSVISLLCKFKFCKVILDIRPFTIYFNPSFLIELDDKSIFSKK